MTEPITDEITIETSVGPRKRNAEIRRVRIEDIVDNPLNFRTHDDVQREAFRATVGEIGWYGYPDVFEHPEHPGKVVLIDGELRTEHLLEHYGPEASIDVNVCDFTPSEADKALATKDPLAAMAGSDVAKHAVLLRALEAEGEDFRALVEQLAKVEGIDLDPLPAETWVEHEIPKPSAKLATKWKAKPGKLWEARGRGLHRISVGDPGNATAVDYLFEGEQPMMLLSKPTAGITGTAYRLAVCGVFYVWYTPETVVEIVGHLHDNALEIRTQLIWRHAGDPIRGGYPNHHDAALYAVAKGKPSFWNGSRTENTMSEGEVPLYGALPLHLVGRPIYNHGSGDDAVFDPYAGNTLGSVVIAAERLGRPSFAMVQDERQAGAILERLSNEGATIQ